MQGEVSGEVQALRIAFDALFPLARPPRQAAVLRAALNTLINDHQAPPLFAAADKAAPTWPELRRRLRAAMRHDKISAADLAPALGIRPSTCQRALSPRGPAPGPNTQAAALDWLNARAASANGHSAQHRRHPSRDAQHAAEPERENGDSNPHKLNHTQREQLAAVVQMDPRALRHVVTADLAQQAVAGAELPGEIVDRLSTFLAAQTSSAAS